MNFSRVDSMMAFILGFIDKNQKNKHFHFLVPATKIRAGIL
jgi:hypothetical protein